VKESGSRVNVKRWSGIGVSRKHLEQGTTQDGMAGVQPGSTGVVIGLQLQIDG